MARTLFLGALLAVVVLVAPVVATGATAGGGSSVAAGQAGSSRFIVSGIGTITKVGPRHSASVVVALYRVRPGAKKGQLMAYRQLNRVPANPQATDLIVRATCIRVRVPRVWFVVVMAESKATRTGPVVRIRDVGPSYRVNCA